MHHHHYAIQVPPQVSHNQHPIFSSPMSERLPR